MKTLHETRTARAARAIAARLETEPAISLYARTARAKSVLFRIHNYLNRYCGSYCYSMEKGSPLIIVTKNRE